VSDNGVVWIGNTRFSNMGDKFFFSSLRFLATCYEDFRFRLVPVRKEEQQENREALIRNHADSHASDKIRQEQSSVKEKDKPKVRGFKENA